MLVKLKSRFFLWFNIEQTWDARTREAYLIPEMVSAQQGMFILNSLSCKAHALEIAPYPFFRVVKHWLTSNFNTVYVLVNVIYAGAYIAFWTGCVGECFMNYHCQDKRAAPIEDRITKIKFPKSYLKMQYDLKMEKQY